MSGFGAINLQLGFIIAILIGALLLVDRQRGEEESLGRRATQGMIAVILTLLVISGTTAFIRAPSPLNSVDLFSDSSEDQDALKEYLKDSAQRESVAGSVHAGFGIALAAVGAVLYRRLRILPLAFLLGGILLLVLGTPSGSAGGDYFSALTAAYGSVGGDAGQTRDIIRFSVLLAGAVLLLEFVYLRWEAPERKSDVAIEPMT